MQKVFQILRSVLSFHDFVFLLPFFAAEESSRRTGKRVKGRALPDALEGIQLKRNIHNFDDACA